MVAQRDSRMRSFATRAFGYDVFLSFALGEPPRGTQRLAADLARQLRARDLAVFFSEEEAEPGSDLWSTLMAALRRSRVLVVLVNQGTLEDPRYLREEVREFRRMHAHRPIVPLSIGRALPDAIERGHKDDWIPFRDRIWIDVEQDAETQGRAPDNLVDRLALAPRGVRTLAAWRWVVRGSMALLAAGVAGLSLLSWQIARQRDEALAAQLQAQISATPHARPDERLLLAVEGMRRHQDRADARLRVIALLAGLADQRALLRPGIHAATWAVSDDGAWLAIDGFEPGESALVRMADWRITYTTSAQRPAAGARSHPILVLSPDGSLLVRADQAKWIVQPLVKGQPGPARTIDVPRALQTAGLLRLSPDGRLALVVTRFETWLWPLGGSAATLRRLADRPALCAAFSADGKQVRLVLERAGMTAIVAGAAGDGEAAVSASRAYEAPADAYSRDCTLFASTDAQPDGTYRVVIRDGPRGEPVSMLSLDSDTPKPALGFSDDGSLLAVVTKKVMGVWRTADGQELWRGVAPVPRLLGTLRFDPSARWLTYSSGDPPMTDRHFEVVDARTGRQLLDRTVGVVQDVVFGPDAVLPLGDEGIDAERLLRAWLPERVDRLAADDAVYLADSIAMPRPGLLISFPLGRLGVDVWDLPLGAHAYRAWPDREWGDWLVATDHENDTGGSPFLVRNALVRDGPVGRVDPRGVTAGLESLAAANNGRLHAVGLRDGTVHLLERGRDNAVVSVFQGSSTSALAIASDGRTVAAGSNDGRVALIDGTNGHVRPLAAAPGTVKQLAFSADGDLLAVVTQYGDVSVHRTDGHDPPATLGRQANSGGGRALRFLGTRGDGIWLLVGDTLWDVERRTVALRLPADSAGRSAGKPAGRPADLMAIEPTADLAAVVWHFADGSLRVSPSRPEDLQAESCRLVTRNLSCAAWRQSFGAEPYRKTCEDLPAPDCQ